MPMRTIAKMPATAGMVMGIGAIGLSLAGCDQGVEDAQEDLAEQRLESREDVIEEKADLQEEMGNEAAGDELDEQADAMGEAADDVD